MTSDQARWIILQDTVRDRRALVDAQASALTRENAIVFAVTAAMAIAPLPVPGSVNFVRDTQLGAVFMMTAFASFAYWFAVRHVPVAT